MRCALVLAIALAACSGENPACPADEPASCPSPAPSYASQVGPLIDQYCAVGCHTAGGTASDRPLDSYATVFARRSGVLDQTYQCAMPPIGSPVPSEPDRAAILGWLVCGAPNN
jgi:hypothetical protein